MTYGIGNYGGYPMMGSMYGMGGIAGVPGGNYEQYFKAKYGCEDCFKTGAYYYELPKPVTPMPKDDAKPSFWRRLMYKIFG